MAAPRLQQRQCSKQGGERCLGPNKRQDDVASGAKDRKHGKEREFFTFLLSVKDGRVHSAVHDPTLERADSPLLLATCPACEAAGSPKTSCVRLGCFVWLPCCLGGRLRCLNRRTANQLPRESAPSPCVSLDQGRGTGPMFCPTQPWRVGYAPSEEDRLRPGFPVTCHSVCAVPSHRSSVRWGSVICVKTGRSG